MTNYTESNPLPMRFPATNPPVAGDHVDIGVWAGGWRFMTDADRARFEAMPVAGDHGQDAHRRAFEGQARELAGRSPYTSTADDAAVQAAGQRHVIALDDARDTFAGILVERLAKLQTTTKRGPALAYLTDLAETADEIARIAREARQAMMEG